MELAIKVSNQRVNIDYMSLWGSKSSIEEKHPSNSRKFGASSWYAGVKLKQATAVAGDVAKTAGSSVADAAERAGSVVRSRWSLLQQQQSKDGGPTMQERWRTTSTAIKKNLLETKEKVAVGLQDTKEKVVVGLSDTKEKVAVGRVKVEEVWYFHLEPSCLEMLLWKYEMDSLIEMPHSTKV